MKKTAFFLAAFLLIFNFAFAQQDPNDSGLQDSIIVDSISVPLGQPYCFISVHAVTDDNVGFFLFNFGWFSFDDRIHLAASSQLPICPESWLFDTLIVERNMLSMRWLACLDSVCPCYLFTDYIRQDIFTFRFLIESDAQPQVVRLDTLTDENGRSLFFGLANGAGFIPAFKSGAIVIGNSNGTEKDPLAKSFSISQNYPNPFNPSTKIEFTLIKRGHTLLAIFDLLGRQIRKCVDRELETGRYSILWDGKDDLGNDVPSGTYFYKLTSGDFTRTMKMVLVR